MLHRPEPAVLHQNGDGPVWVLDITSENGTDLHVFFDDEQAARDWLTAALAATEPKP